MSSWCQACGSADMTTGDDGTFFCQICGTQNENYIEEAFDNDQAHVFSARFVRETRVAATQNEAQAATQGSEIPPEILAGSQAFLSQPAPGEKDELSPADAFGTPYGTGSGGGLSQTAQSLGSQFGLNSKKSKQPPIGKEELSTSIRKSYVEGIQRILFLQCETLVKDFHVTPLICGIIGPLWIRYLASTRVFEKIWADEALEVAEDRERRRKNSRRRVQKDPGPEESEEPLLSGGALAGPNKTRRRKPRKRKGVVEPRTTFGRKARYVWLSALKERIPLSITLSLSYLSCYMGRETILPTDIRRWALKGKLPFLAAYLELSKPSNKHIPRTLGGLQMFPMDAKVMFKPKNLVGARAVELLAGHIAERLGLQLPPVNYHALSGRLLRALKLPVEKLLVYTHRIYEWYCPSGLWLTSKESALPTRVYVMAMIIIVLKVLYKLDGRSETQIQSEAARNETFIMKSLYSRESDGAYEDTPEDMQVDSGGPFNSGADVISPRHTNRDAGEEEPEAPGVDVSSQKVEEMWDVKELLSHVKKMKPFHRESSTSKPQISFANWVYGMSTLAALEKKHTMGDPERKLAAYLKYCRDVIYPGPASDEGEETMRNNFWEVYEKAANEAAEKKQRGETEQDDEGAVNRGEEEESGHLGDNMDTEGRTETIRYSTRTHGSVGSVAGVRDTVQSSKPKRRIEGQDVAKDAYVQEESGYGVEDSDPAEEDARYAQNKESQRLIKEMRKLGFSCLPPLAVQEVPENVYVKYTYQVSDKELRPVHEEYFVILRVCAKLIKVHPKALHWGVQKVEQGLTEVEKNTRDFMLSQEGDIAKVYKMNFGETTEYRVRDRTEEFKRKKQKLMLARYRVDEGVGSEKDYTDLILHADYL